MKKISIWLLIVLLGSLYCATPARAQQSTPEPTVDPEQEIYQRLEVINPGAVPIFREATLAMQAEDYLNARKGFEQVLVLAPGFPEAERNLSLTELYLDNVPGAIEHGRKAVAADPSSTNQAILGLALLNTENSEDAQEALRLAYKAVEQSPYSYDANLVLALAGLANGDLDAMRLSSSTLQLFYPQEEIGYQVAEMVSVQETQTAGLSRQTSPMQGGGSTGPVVSEPVGSSVEPAGSGWLLWLEYLLGGWLGGFVVLFLFGAVLSSATLASVNRPYHSANYELRKTESVIRRIYQLVIGMTSLYFYLSVPMLILVILLVVGGIIYLFIAAGRIPLRLLLMIGAAGLYTLFAVVRSLFIRIPESEPGRPLPRQEAPELWALAEDVARRLGTRPVDAIYLTHGVEVAVTERGEMWAKLRGAGQRCLVLGLGALPGMTQGQLQAILAHEYGHFSNKDTAGGNLARQVRGSLYQMAFGLAVTGQAEWYNPAWWFVNGFQWLFLRITLGASRLQEILADRYAVMAFGTRDFIDGLQHIVRQEIQFNLQLGQVVQAHLQTKENFQNLYSLPDLEVPELRQELEKQYQQALARPASAYDSHPGVQERILLVEQTDASRIGLGSSKPVWDLLPEAQKLQDQMTQYVQANIRIRVVE